MFTGLIEEMGTVKSIKRRAGSRELSISGKKVAEDIRKGDSISVNGACLTVSQLTSLPVSQFKVDVSPGTLKKTNFGELRIGEKVNLERALKIGGRLGGHFVSGHIDGVGIIKKSIKEKNAFLFEIETPDEIANYLIPRGSIAVDGISLTVVDFNKNRFRISIIPHTREVTTLRFKRAGDKVNLEADMIAKCVFALLQAKKKAGITQDFLRKYNY